MSRSLNHLLFTAPEWMESAPCRGLTDLFYNEKGNVSDSVQAKAVCNECEHKVRCLEYALDNNEMYGVWGGTTSTDRRHIIARRRDMGWTVGRNRKPVVKHGAESGWEAHQRAGEDPCDTCRRWHEWRQREQSNPFEDYRIRAARIRREREAS